MESTWVTRLDGSTIRIIMVLWAEYRTVSGYMDKG